MKSDDEAENMKRLAKIDVQLDRLAFEIVKGFSRLETRLETKADKSDLQRIYDLLDKIANQQEIDNDERLVVGHQLERLDRWAHELPKKIGYRTAGLAMRQE